MLIPPEIKNFLHPHSIADPVPSQELANPSMVGVLYEIIMSGTPEVSGDLESWLNDRIAEGHTLTIIEELLKAHATARTEEPAQ